MGNFNLDDYEPVDSRIKKFYSDHKDGRIITQLVDCTEIKTVIFKAMIYIGDILKSTGYAMEEKGAGYVNKTSHLENCETSAIGRGLANMGYSGDKRPSREEMLKVAKGEKVKAGSPKAGTIAAIKKEIADVTKKNLECFDEKDKAHFKGLKEKCKGSAKYSDWEDLLKDVNTHIAKVQMAKEEPGVF
jgi:hypothetical protein